MSVSATTPPEPSKTQMKKIRVWTWDNLKKDFRKNKYLYFMISPVVLFYFLFHYMPMYGAVIAFQRFVPAKGIWGSRWVGLKHFINFFESEYFVRLFRNTFLISFYGLLFGLPAAILLALLLNEVRHRLMKNAVQTVSYIPHFVSVVVICGMVVEFTSSSGLLNDIIVFFGGERGSLLGKPELFRSIYIASEIWQQVGWNSIIFLASLAAIDPTMYEAAEIDGASRFQQVMHITFPTILPTIMIILILRIGQSFTVGHEKIILLYNPATYKTADVLMTYVYRVGLESFNWSFSAAVGIFNSIVNLSLLLLANGFSRRMKQASLW